MRVVAIFIGVILLCSCESNNHYRPSDKEKAVNEILAFVSSNLKKEKELIPFGSGGQTMYQVKMLALAFQYRNALDIEQGRELLLESVREFTSTVNADEHIRNYLSNYPFEAKNVIVEIYIKNPDGTNLESSKLCVIAANEGILEYEIRDPKTDRLTRIYTETYEEALQKVSQGK